jgi:hypothetical protein
MAHSFDDGLRRLSMQFRIVKSVGRSNLILVPLLSIFLAILFILWSPISDLYRKSEYKYYKFSAYFSIFMHIDAFSNSPPPTLPSRRITQGVGLNVHMQYHDTPYDNTARVIDLLHYIQVDRVRDIAPSSQNELGIYKAMAGKGIRFDLFSEGTPGSDRLIIRLAADSPGSVIALEGPNEIDNFAVAYGRESGRAAANRILASLRQMARGPLPLHGTPVFMYTGFRPESPDVLGNIHVYTRRGQNPTAELLGAIGSIDNSARRRPFTITETGYFTGSQEDGWGGVDEAGQARGLLEDLLDAFRMGADSLFIYELLDEAPDKGAIDQEHHFGVFDQTYRPKPAAVALRNFMTLLHAAPQGVTAVPDPSIDPSVAHALVIRDTEFAYSLVIWRPSRQGPGPADVRVDLNRVAPSAEVFYPLASSHAQRTYHGVRTVTVDPTGGPVILTVKG